MIPLGGLSQGDDSPGELTSWGTIPQGKRPPGAQWSRTRLSDPSGRGFESRPPPGPPGAQIRPGWPRMLRGRFWLQNQDFGASVGAICIICRDLSVPTGPRVPGWGDGRQNGAVARTARLSPERSPPERRQKGSQIGGPARTVRTPERPERQNDNSLPAGHGNKDPRPEGT